MNTRELKKQYIISVVTFFFSGIVATVSTGFAFFTTKSILFLLQFLLSLSGFLIHAIFLYTSREFYKNPKVKHEHYHGKLESFGTATGQFLVYANVLVMFVMSVYRLLYPAEIAQMTVFSRICCVISILYNVFIIIRCKRNEKATGNMVMRAQFLDTLKNLLSWVFVAVATAMSDYFGQMPFTMYVEPSLCIVLVIITAYTNFPLLKKCSLDLLDLYSSEEITRVSNEVLRKYKDDYREVLDTRTRSFGHISVMEIVISYDKELPYSAVFETNKKIKKEIEEMVRDSRVNIISK